MENHNHILGTYLLIILIVEINLNLIISPYLIKNNYYDL